MGAVAQASEDGRGLIGRIDVEEGADLSFQLVQVGRFFCQRLSTTAGRVR